MILQRLISEATALPDLSSEVKEAQREFNSIGSDLSAKDLETMAKVTIKTYACETTSRRKVSVKTVEMGIVKAKHASVEEDEEDFV